MKISHSRLTTYQLCPRLYYWKFVQNLIKPKTPMPLIVGRAVHAGLAAHYAGEDASPHILEEFARIREEEKWLPQELEELAAQEAYAHYIIEKYKAEYPKEPFTVLAPEVEGSIPLGPHTFFFRADGLASARGLPMLLEHKTTGQFGDMFFKKFRMDGQITAYCFAMWQETGTRPVGAIINAIRKSKKLDRVEFARDTVLRSEQMMLQYMDQVLQQADRIEQLVELNSYGAWSMHTQSCVAWHRECDYTSLCYSPDKPELRNMYVEREPDYVDKGDKK